MGAFHFKIEIVKKCNHEKPEIAEKELF